MKVSILIGFEYNHLVDNNFVTRCFGDDPVISKIDKKLPGIQVDLYQAYLASIKMNCDRIIVVTDIDKDIRTISLVKSALESTSDANIFTFIENSKLNQHHYLYQDMDKFKEIIVEKCDSADQVFIYYTGHAKEGQLIFPRKPDEELYKICQVPISVRINQPSVSKSNGLLNIIKNGIIDRYDMKEFLHLITSSVSKQCEIFIVLDCCYSTGLQLPFKLINDDKQYYYCLNDGSRVFFPQKIICISSCDIQEKSITTNTGSIFSKCLFETIKNRIRSIPSIIHKIKNKCQYVYKQTVTVYSSYPDLFILWAWLFGDSQASILIDNHTNSIIIEKLSHD